MTLYLIETIQHRKTILALKPVLGETIVRIRNRARIGGCRHFQVGLGQTCTATCRQETLADPAPGAGADRRP
jgi:hypothetical protein